MKAVFILLSTILIISVKVYSQTTLQAGNVAVLGFNTTGTTPSADNFAFILLTDVEGGTQINFTDNGWKSNGTFRAAEGILTWTAPAEGVARSTVISLYCDGTIISGPGTAVRTPGTDFNFNTKGDQIIIYQNNSAPYNFIFALTNNNEWQSDAIDSHTSALPTGLTNGVNAIAIPKDGTTYANNAVYNGCNPGGITSGTPEQILAAVTSPSYWIGSETSTVQLPQCTFTVGGLIIQYITYNKMKIDWNDLETNNEIFVICKAGSAFGSATPSGDGSAYTANSDFSLGGTAFDGGKVVYKGSGSDVVVTGLTQGTAYYFEAFGHIIGSPDWGAVQLSSPVSAIAAVQDISNLTASSTEPTNSSVSLSWTASSSPANDYWNGGTVVVYRIGNEVSWIPSGNSADYTIGQNLGSGNIVAWKGTSASAVFSTLEQNTHYYFKVFNNHQSAWSNGVQADASTTGCEILVEGNNIEILDDDDSPSLSDFTDFGNVIQGLSVSKIFKIKNIGTGPLAITGTPRVSLSGSGDFAVSVQPSATVSAGNGVTQFTIVFTPSSSGEKTALVNIPNDDTNENPYNFIIKGTGTVGLSFYPDQGPVGTIVTISGSGFSGGVSSVTINGTAATDVTILSDTELTAKVASGTTTGSITVNRVVGGAQNSTGSFTVLSSAGNCN